MARRNSQGSRATDLSCLLHRVSRRALILWLLTFSSFTHWVSHPLPIGMALGLLVGYNMTSAVHDLVHLSPVDRSSRLLRLGAPLLTPFGLVSATWWQRKHILSHHRYLNNVVLDDDTLSLARVLDDTPYRWFYRFQPIYLPLASPLALVGLGIGAVHYSLRRRSTIRGCPRGPTDRLRILVEVALGPVLFGALGHLLGILPQVLILLVASWLTAGSFLAAVFLPTHGALSSSTASDDLRMRTRPRAQAEMSVDYAVTSRFATWLTGGLNLHIEHHLRPTVPSWRLRNWVVPCREWAQREDVVLQEFGNYPAALRAWWLNVVRLSHPPESIEPDGRG